MDAWHARSDDERLTVARGNIQGGDWSEHRYRHSGRYRTGARRPSGGVSRAVLEAVAIEAYRSRAITPAQVQQMLGLRSRWETESFLWRSEAFHDYTMDDLERDIAAIPNALHQ